MPFRRLLFIPLVLCLFAALPARAELSQFLSKDEFQSLAAELSHTEKEPGRTAKELGIRTVYHLAQSLEEYEILTRRPDGTVNAFVDRKGVMGERAYWGEGFYTNREVPPRAAGVPVELHVDPTAVDGVDFRRAMEGIVIWLRPEKLRVLSLSRDQSLAVLKAWTEDRASALEKSCSAQWKEKPLCTQAWSRM